MKKNDIYLFICLLAISGFLALGIFAYENITTKSPNVQILIEGELYGEYPLNQDLTLNLVSDNGTNVMEIRDGSVSIIEADCPDKICVNHKAINKNGQQIVCLPHKIVLEIKNGEADLVDGTTN